MLLNNEKALVRIKFWYLNFEYCLVFRASDLGFHDYI